MSGLGDPQSVIKAGLAALEVGDAARAAALLREAAAGAAAAEFPWFALANAELVLDNLDGAEAAIDRQLELAFRDVSALLVKASLRERNGDTRGASNFYQTAINQAAVTGCPPLLQSLLEHGRTFVASASNHFAEHLLASIDRNLSPAMRAAVDMLTGKTELKLQQPSMFYYPFLPQRWFYEPAEFPWLEAVIDQTRAMQGELEADHEAGFKPYVTVQPGRPAPNHALLNDMAWSALFFWQNGAIVEANAARCPATMSGLAQAPMPMIPGRSPNALWSRLRPGAHIAPHHGMLNTRLICHVPIRTVTGCTLRVGNETREWRDGVPLIFDDSVEHEARNSGTADRVVLLFEIWRPDIPEEDRRVLSEIFQSIQTFGVD